MSQGNQRHGRANWEKVSRNSLGLAHQMLTE